MELPNEVWSVILSFCDGQSLDSSVRFVCRHFRKLEDDQALWKAKCLQRKLDVSFKKPDETWKQFYFYRPLQLFPLYGIEIGKTTADELNAIPGIYINEFAKFAILNNIDFWFQNDDSVFQKMYFVAGKYVLPKEWEKIGITYDRSWNEYLMYLKFHNHNYQIMDTPHIITSLWKKKHFTATVQTVCKHEDIYFPIVFSFAHREGNENSKKTLDKITIDREVPEEERKKWKHLYENNVIDNNGYIAAFELHRIKEPWSLGTLIEQQNVIGAVVAQNALETDPKI